MHGRFARNFEASWAVHLHSAYPGNGIFDNLAQEQFFTLSGVHSMQHF